MKKKAKSSIHEFGWCYSSVKSIQTGALHYIKPNQNDDPSSLNFSYTVPSIKNQTGV